METLFEITKRWERGIKSIGLRWHKEAWADKGIQFQVWHPAKHQDFPKPSRFILKMVWGPGAGYINGYTGFVAINCLMRDYQDSHKRRRIQFGFTQNANAIPMVYR